VGGKGSLSGISLVPRRRILRLFVQDVEPRQKKRKRIIEIAEGKGDVHLVEKK